MTIREFAVIGVPTSAGAHHAGQDRSPAVLRERGLLERLRARGVFVHDVGDVAGEVWAPDAAVATARNLDAVVRVAQAVAAGVERQVRAGRIPLVLGGDCTITLGVVTGVQRAREDVRLIYFDGDADLGSPGSGSGILDASGMAHLLGIADTALARIGRRYPLLAEHEVTMLGYDATDADSFDETALTSRPGLVHASDAVVRTDPVGTAERAVAAVAADGASVIVHFDVDAVDSRDLALANFPHYGTGVSLAAAGQVLSTLLRTPGLAAVVLTEVNPTHDPSHVLVDRYLDTVTRAIAAAR